MRHTILLVCLVACADATTNRAPRTAADSVRADSTARARQDSINRTRPDYVVDSIFPVEEEIRRFRVALGGTPVTAFAGGSTSREALVRRFVAAVAAADTSALREMLLNVREYADLYYMDSPSSRPPYRQSPALAWEMIQHPSSEGINKLLRRLGGKPLTYVSHTCDAKVEHDGPVSRYAGCLVSVTDASGPSTGRAFGSILERGGQFKFLSYTNDF